MSLTEIQRELGVSTSSLAATLRILVQLGYLHHDRSTRTYAPTLLLAVLGGWVASRFAPSRAIQEGAREINRRTGKNVAIAHRNDIRLQYLSFIPGKNLEPTIRVGTTRLLCRSGLGWALLTFLTPRAILSIVRRTNAAQTTEDHVEAEAIMSVVDQCRAAGFVRAEHTVRPGYGVIAMPLPNQKLQLAIGVSGPVGELKDQEREIVQIMREALHLVSP